MSGIYEVPERCEMYAPAKNVHLVVVRWDERAQRERLFRSTTKTLRVDAGEELRLLVEEDNEQDTVEEARHQASNG